MAPPPSPTTANVALSPRREVAGSLEELMGRYADGDLEAFATIYERTWQRVRAYLVMMSRSGNRADDLVQTTYLKLHRGRSGYLRGAPVVPWLMAIARNVFLDDARRRGRARVHVTHTGDLPELVDPKSLAPPPLGLGPAIEAAVQTLTPRQREAFVLTKHKGLSPRDAARLLGTTEMAVKLRVHRAYLALRELLAPFAPPQPS